MLVTPASTTTYTLTAGGATKSVTVTVDITNVKSTVSSTVPTSVPKISNFSVNPKAITLGDNTTLSWSVTGVRSVSISPSVGTSPAAGSILVVPAGTTTYTLTALNNYGTENATATVTVSTLEGTGPSIKSFTATPSTISAGATSKLSWNIAGATAISIDQGIGIPSSHYMQEVSPTETTTYTLTALNGSGTDSATVTVTVNP
jgi:hypothetical protein